MQNHEPIRDEQLQGAGEQPLAPQEPMGKTTEPSTPAAPQRASATKWIWIAVAGAGLGMCILCSGALTLLGLLGALSSERSQAQVTPPSSFGGAPAGGNFAPYGGASAGGGFMPYDYSAPSIGYPYSGSDSSTFLTPTQAAATFSTHFGNPTPSVHGGLKSGAARWATTTPNPPM
jgi:hypothetical protein